MSDLIADGRAIDIPREGWPDFTGATAIKLSVRSTAGVVTTFTGTAPVVGSGSQTLRFEMTSTQSAALSTGTYDTQLVLATGGKFTPISGTFTAAADITP